MKAPKSLKSPTLSAHVAAIFFVLLTVAFLFSVRHLFALPFSPLALSLAVAVGCMAGCIFFVAVAIEVSILRYPMEDQ